MRSSTGLILLACASLLCAQAPEDAETTRARAEVERLRGLVASGVAPRAQLEKAEASLVDARDADLLRKTVYGQDLTEGQSDEMLAAAGRRIERRQKAFDDARRLVAAGALPPLSLEPLQKDVDGARRELELAESRARLTREVARMAEAEEALLAQLERAPAEAPALAERFDGDGIFNMVTFSRVETAFFRRFGKPLPISAIGETAVHRAMGFDHRGRVDVPLHPDTPEGAWLREYLIQYHIPFFAFRQAVAGKATGAHIHIGPISSRLSPGG